MKITRATVVAAVILLAAGPLAAQQQRPHGLRVLDDPTGVQTATDIPSVVAPRTDQTPSRIGVPVVEPNSRSALLFTVGVRDDTPARDAFPFSPPYQERIPTVGQVGLVVLGVFWALFLVFAFYCSDLTGGCWA
jgi:hypothetical protein